VDVCPIDSIRKIEEDINEGVEKWDKFIDKKMVNVQPNQGNNYTEFKNTAKELKKKDSKRVWSSHETVLQRSLTLKGTEENEEVVPEKPQKSQKSGRDKRKESLSLKSGETPVIKRRDKDSNDNDNKRLSTVLSQSIQEDEPSSPPPTPVQLKLPKDYTTWDKHKLSEWASSSGLDSFALKINSEDIDGEVLSEMTDSDFEKMGLNLGQRKKITKAIMDNK